MNDQCHIHAKQLRNNTFDSFPGPKAIPVKPNEYYVNEDYAQTDDRWKKDEILAAKIKKFLSVSYVLCGHVTLGNHVVTTQPRGWLESRGRGLSQVAACLLRRLLNTISPLPSMI